MEETPDKTCGTGGSGVLGPIHFSTLNVASKQ